MRLRIHQNKFKKLMGMVAQAMLSLALLGSDHVWGQSMEPARQTETPAGESSIAGLIEQLDAHGLADRNAAESLLIKRGQPVLQWLSDNRFPCSAEMGHRLQRIRNQIQRQQIAQAHEPRRIQIEGKYKLSEVVVDIEQQSGNQTAGRNDAGQERDVVLNQLTYWESIAWLGNEFGARIDYDSTTANRLVLTDRNTNLPAARRGHSHFGLLRAELVSASRNRQGLITQMRMRVLWEPRVRMITLSAPLSGFVLSGDRGQLLAKFNANAILNVQPPPNKCYVQLDVPVQQIVQSSGAKILRCQIASVLAGPQVTMTFPDLFGQRTAWTTPVQSFADVLAKVNISPGPANAKRVELHLQYDPRAMGTELESHFRWQELHSAVLVDPDGRRIAARSVRQIEQQPASYKLEFTFQPPADSSQNHWDLLVEFPSGLLVLNTPFELELDK